MSEVRVKGGRACSLRDTEKVVVEAQIVFIIKSILKEAGMGTTWTNNNQKNGTQSEHITNLLYN